MVKYEYMVIRLYLANRGMIRFARRYEGGENIRDVKSQYACKDIGGANQNWEITNQDPVFESVFSKYLQSKEIAILGWKTEIDLLNAAGQEGWSHYMIKKKEFSDMEKIDGAEEMVSLYFKRIVE